MSTPEFSGDELQGCGMTFGVVSGPAFQSAMHAPAPLEETVDEFRHMGPVFGHHDADQPPPKARISSLARMTTGIRVCSARTTRITSGVSWESGTK